MKKTKHIVVGFLLLLTIYPYQAFAGITLPYNGSIPAKDYTNIKIDFDSLRMMYGKNKKIPQEFEKQILLALSHYPELVETIINFVVKETLIPIASRPSSGNIFRRKSKWVYTVIISKQSRAEMEPALLKNLPFNAQVGVVGHELAHTVYYLGKSKGDVIGIGLAYVSGKFRARFEKDTDRRTINHGLGWQLLDWAKALRPDNASNQYIDKFYLHPAEIEAYMQRSGLYGHVMVEK